MQFGEGAFPESSQALLLTTAFEDEDETPNAERQTRSAWRTPTVKDLSDYCFG
jgi:hypothetical protein